MLDNSKTETLQLERQFFHFLVLLKSI